MGIIEYTHGVSKAAKPNPSDTKNKVINDISGWSAPLLSPGAAVAILVVSVAVIVAATTFLDVSATTVLAIFVVSNGVAVDSSPIVKVNDLFFSGRHILSV